jgi:hypothetical protein
MHGEIDYSKDPQSESPHGYDVFGNELYEGSTIWRGDEGVMLDPDTDNYDPNNPIMTLLVQQLGTRYILDQLGYVKQVIE